MTDESCYLYSKKYICIRQLYNTNEEVVVEPSSAG